MICKLLCELELLTNQSETKIRQIVTSFLDNYNRAKDVGGNDITHMDNCYDKIPLEKMVKF